MTNGPQRGEICCQLIARTSRAEGNCRDSWYWREIAERFVDDVAILDVHGGPIALGDGSIIC